MDYLETAPPAFKEAVTEDDASKLNGLNSTFDSLYIVALSINFAQVPS